ncbi:MAG TPA: TlyA family RNA methyltransferase, partial [Blastocatellia bacterium]|nr:TlyA family RNA methyltransferase [Blastocatellia bacterium]
NGFFVLGLTESPILGGEGNREFLIHLSCSIPDELDMPDIHKSIVTLTPLE